MSEPALIPRKLVYRLAADLLFAQADRLEQIAAGSGKRHGRLVDAPAADSKRTGRLQQVGRLRAAGVELVRLANADDPLTKGAGVDAAVVGYLLGLVGGYSDLRSELEAELADIGRAGCLEAVSGDDFVALVKRVVSGA